MRALSQMQWWNSIESLQFTTFVANWIIAIAGIITASAAVVTLVVGSRIDTLEDEREAERDRVMKQTIQDVGTKTIETAQRVETLPEVRGFLTPSNRPTPDLSNVGPIIGMLNNVPETTVLLIMGSSVTVVDSLPSQIISQGGEPMFSIGKGDGGIWFSAKFFDENGDALCEIVKNEFNRSLKTTLRIERTPSTITVFDNQSKPVVFVDYINPQCIKVLGDFYLRQKRRVLLTPTFDNLIMPGSGCVFRLGPHGVDIPLYVPPNEAFPNLKTAAKLPQLNRDAMLGPLSIPPSKGLTIYLSAADKSKALGDEFASLLSEAGWKVEREEYNFPVIGVAVVSPPPGGWDDLRARHATEELVKVLDTNGIPTKRRSIMMGVWGKGPDDVRIIVGPIPENIKDMQVE